MDQSNKRTLNPQEYNEILLKALAEMRAARISIAKQVTNSVNSVYWSLGKLLSEKQLNEGYGNGVVRQLSIDLKTAFPDMGLSPRNLWDMKRFYERYCGSDAKVRQAVALLPWGHNLMILAKVKDDDCAGFYASKAIIRNCSRDLSEASIHNEN